MLPSVGQQLPATGGATRASRRRQGRRPPTSARSTSAARRRRSSPVAPSAGVRAEISSPRRLGGPLSSRPSIVDVAVRASSTSARRHPQPAVLEAAASVPPAARCSRAAAGSFGDARRTRSRSARWISAGRLPSTRPRSRPRKRRCPQASAGGDELSLPQAPAASRRARRANGAAGAAAELSLPVHDARSAHERGRREALARAARVMVLFLLLALGGGVAAAHQARRVRVPHHRRLLHAKDYAQRPRRRRRAAARTRTSKDTYPEARGAVDDLLAAHWRMPRARQLTAYAAFAEFAYEMRFGADAARNAKAKLLVAELAERAGGALPQRGARRAGRRRAATSTRLRKALDAASKRDAGDPIQQDIALLRGEVELAGHGRQGREGRVRDRAQARPLGAGALRPGARRPARRHDWDDRRAASATPRSPPRRTTRARCSCERCSLRGEGRRHEGALADLAAITDGASKPLASTREIGEASRTRGIIYLQSGRAGDARGAFEAALKLDAAQRRRAHRPGHGALPGEPLHRGAHALRHGAAGAPRRRARHRATTRSRR